MTLIQSLDQANPWNQQLVAHFGEPTPRRECNKGFSLPNALGHHHSGRVTVGTQSLLTFRLSSQNEFSFSRAGSFQPFSFGFCQKEKVAHHECRPPAEVITARTEALASEANARHFRTSFCPNTDKAGSKDVTRVDNTGNPQFREAL